MRKKVTSGIMLALLSVGIFSLVLHIQPVRAEPTTWTVDDDGGADFTRIQDAIYVASSGDIIYVYNGTYHEHIHSSKSLTFIGENKFATIIDGSGHGPVVVISAPNTNFTSFTVRNAGWGNWETDNGIRLYQTRSSQVTNCIVYGGAYGIREIRESWGVGGSNVISNNMVSDATEIAIGSSHASSVDNIVAYNIITNSTNGIYFNNPYNMQIIGNHIFGTESKYSQYGIHLQVGGLNNTIIGNKVEYSENAIRLDYADSNVVKDNVVENSTFGVFVGYESSDNIVVGNSASGSSIGFMLWDKSNDNLVTNNLATNNGYGIALLSSSSNKIYHNNFIGNSQQVLNLDSQPNVWDDGYPNGGNYWSDLIDVDENSGPNQNEPGNDGIWDRSYDVDISNTDRFPLVNPWVPRTVGVQVGDWVKFSVEIVGYRPGFPVDLNDVEWGKSIVQAISDTTIEVELLWHLKNGTEIMTTGTVDVVTSGYPGPTSMTGLFVSKDLPAGATLYATYPFGAIPPSLKINETVFKEYLGVSRETNRAEGTKGVRIDAYWDKATGILSEYNEDYEGYFTWSLRFKVVDTNLWEPASPTESVQKLIETVAIYGLPQGTENSLTSKLRDALHLLGIGNENGATHKLMEFINQVEALRNKKLTDEQANDLVSEAQRIMDLINE